jgi:hypothetical protein
MQRLRAELLRKLGREPEALEIEAELRRLLVYADADHVIVRYLNQQRGTSQSKTTNNNS